MGIGKKCIIKNCNLEASYNWQHLNVRKYCNNHKEDGMVNIVNKLLLNQICETNKQLEDIYPLHNF